MPGFVRRRVRSAAYRDASRRPLAAGRASLVLLCGLIAANLSCGGSESANESPYTEPPSILLCIGDDWSWPHAGAYGDGVVRTPAFDAVARDGILFEHAYVSSPSCTSSRGALLAGQAFHRLREGGNLWSTLPADIAVYPEILEETGYAVGMAGKGWGPGSAEAGGRTRNPAGPRFQSFADFIGELPNGQPFAFWFGGRDPHRPHVVGSGRGAGLDPTRVQVPPFLPDDEMVRDDFLDYYAAVESFDREVGEILALLESTGRLENTIVVVTSDNGMSVPRAKTNLYDAGVRVPLAVRWTERVDGGRVSNELVQLEDLAPTFLAAAGIDPPREMTGRSLLDLFIGATESHRERVFFGRERHAVARRGILGYPARAVRTHDHLYIRNLRPDRWPAGDPDLGFPFGPFGEVDASPAKTALLAGRHDPRIQPLYELALGLRPSEELYDLSSDPFQLENVAGEADYASIRAELSCALDAWMHETGDPRASCDDDTFDAYPYLTEDGTVVAWPRSREAGFAPRRN